METQNWEALLINYFNENKTYSISKQQNLMKETLDMFVEFLKNNSRIKIDFRWYPDNKNKARITIVPFQYTRDLQIEIELNERGEYITIDSTTTIKLEEGMKRIKIEVNENEILNSLTSILVKYKG
jgi:hypothetical protein